MVEVRYESKDETLTVQYHQPSSYSTVRVKGCRCGQCFGSGATQDQAELEALVERFHR